MDPYAPPRSEVSSAPEAPRRRWGAPQSLAVLGLVTFWGTFITGMTLEARGVSSKNIPIAFGLALFVGSVMHLLGAILAAVGRRPRLGGVLANVLPLLVIGALLFIGLSSKRH
jgi:hypothetical protein